MIGLFTDYSRHIPKITASPVCTAIRNDINCIKLCLSFSHGLKFQVVYLKNAPTSGDSVPRPLPGLRPWSPLGSSVIQTPDLPPPQLHLLDPPLNKSLVNGALCDTEYVSFVVMTIA